MRIAVKLFAALLAVALALPAAAVTARQFRPDPEGCEYQWTGSAWTLVDSNCPNGTCSPPPQMGAFVGQTVYKTCDDPPATDASRRGCGCGQ